MLRSWDSRGYLEPLGALVAVSAVGLAVSIYLGAFAGSVDHDGLDDTNAATTAAAVAHTEAGVIEPARLEALAQTHAPAGMHLRITLETDAHQWTGGPTPPEEGETATAARPVTVDRGPGHTEPGRLTVILWYD